MLYVKCDFVLETTSSFPDESQIMHSLKLFVAAGSQSIPNPVTVVQSFLVMIEIDFLPVRLKVFRSTIPRVDMSASLDTYKDLPSHSAVPSL